MASWDRKSGGWSLVNNPYDVEAAGYGSEWDNAEKDVRNGFVRKVFGILSVQLVITAGACALFILNDGVKSFVGQNPWLLFTAFFGVLALLCTFACNPQVARTYPGNYIFLGIFTLLEAFMVGIISASYNTDVVLMAAGVTCFIVIGLTLFALQTKYDFTTYGGILLSILLTVFLGSILLAFLPHNKIANIAYGCLGAMLFSMYLVFDIQLMMAGKKVQISPDDYVFAAINLYLDVINIFLHLLRVFSEMQN